MARLTKRYPNGVVTLDETAFTGEIQETLDREMSAAMQPIKEAIAKLADIEDAEKNGLLVRLPCKVGDTVYVISDKGIVECKIYNITTNIYADNKREGGYYWKGFEIKNNEFGKTVFLTPEEAKQAFKEGDAK